MNSKHRRTPLQPDLYKKTPEVQLIADTLDIANEHGLAAEVMWSALTMAAEANEHGRTMEQVLDAALGEWDI